MTPEKIEAYNDTILILEKKIAYLQSVNEKMFFVSIGILRDLIIEIKEKQNEKST
jgi:hypothetical protein